MDGPVWNPGQTGWGQVDKIIDEEYREGVNPFGSCG
jgi:hypothetical protein